ILRHLRYSLIIINFSVDYVSFSTVGATSLTPGAMFRKYSTAFSISRIVIRSYGSASLGEDVELIFFAVRSLGRWVRRSREARVRAKLYSLSAKFFSGKGANRSIVVDYLAIIKIFLVIVASSIRD